VNDSIRFGMLVVAAAAVAVGGWIGHRATETHPQQRCFGTGKGAISCVDPARGRVSYRVYFIGDNNKVQSLPSG
jgi:hypothetical protein